MGWFEISLWVVGCLLLVPLVYFGWMHGWSYRDRKADALVVLGYKCDGDEIHPLLRDRLDTAIRLWNTYSYRRVILSGGAVTSKLSEAEIMRRYLVAHDVPDERMLLETISRNTVHNLVNCRVMMEEEGLQSCTIVSNSFHIRRIRYIALHIGMPATCYGARDLRALMLQWKLTLGEIKAFKLTLPWIHRAQRVSPGEMMGHRIPQPTSKA